MRRRWHPSWYMIAAPFLLVGAFALVVRPATGFWFGLLLVVAGLAVWRAIVEARRCPQGNNPFGHNPECPCGGEEPSDV